MKNASSNNRYPTLNRAVQLVMEIEQLFGKDRPFTYVLETDIRTGERATFAKSNQLIINQSRQLCCDAIHNIRVSLDHAYWQIVSPFIKSSGRQRNIQFPFCEKEERLEEVIKNRSAHMVSQNFVDALVSLKPYGQAGGNEFLYLIDRMDGINKHRFATPIGDFTRISSEILKRQVPDFPEGIVNCFFGQCNRDVCWSVSHIDYRTIGNIRPPTTHLFEKKLDVPVDIVFRFPEPYYQGPVVATLYKFIEVAKETIEVIEKAVEI